MTPETDSAIAGVSGTITDLAQQQLSAEQIHQIGAARIRALITQIPQINASDYPNERRQLEHIRTNIKTRIDLIQVAIEVAETQQNASRAKELEQTRSALTDLNDALALQGVIKQRFADGGTVGEVAGRAIGTLETAGDRLGIILRDQSTPVQIAANAGLIAAGAAVLWIIWRNAETGILKIGAGLATILAGGAAYLGIPAVRNALDGMAQWMQSNQKEHAAQLKSAQELKQLNETIEKNRVQTDGFLKQFNALRTSTSQGELGAVIGQAQTAVKIEKGLLTDAIIGRFPAPRQKVLRDRIQALDKALADLATEQNRLNNLLQTDKKDAQDKTAAAEKLKNQAAGKNLEDTTKRGNEPVSKAERQPTGTADDKKVQDEKRKMDELIAQQEEGKSNPVLPNQPGAKITAQGNVIPPTQQNPERTPEVPPTIAEIRSILQGLNSLPVGQYCFPRNPAMEFPVGDMRLAVGPNGFRLRLPNMQWRNMNITLTYLPSNVTQSIVNLYRYGGGVQVITQPPGSLLQRATYASPVPVLLDNKTNAANTKLNNRPNVTTLARTNENTFETMIPLVRALRNQGNWSQSGQIVGVGNFRVDIRLT